MGIVGGNGPPEAVLTSGGLLLGAISFAGSTRFGAVPGGFGITTGGTSDMGSLGSVTAGITGTGPAGITGTVAAAGVGTAVGRVGNVSNGAGAPCKGGAGGCGKAPAGGNGGICAAASGTGPVGNGAMGGGGSGGREPVGLSSACIVLGGNGAGGGRLEVLEAAPAASRLPTDTVVPAPAGCVRTAPLQQTNEHPSRVTTNVRRREVKFGPLVSVANRSNTMTLISGVK